MTPEELEGKLKEATSLLKPGEEESIPEDIRHLQEEFAKLLEESKLKQLVVLIDDLDRCLLASAIDKGRECLTPSSCVSGPLPGRAQHQLR